MINIGVLISGSGTNLQAIIDNIENNYIPANISVVISNRKNAFGLERAKNHNIDAVYFNRKNFETDIDFDVAIVSELQKRNIQLVVLAGYLNILTPLFVSNFRNRILNIHPALIPSFCGKGYYGLKVHEAVLEYGAKITGATVHFVDEGADTGAIILQESVNVLNNDTAEILQKRVLTIEHKLLPVAVKLFCENKLEFIECPDKRTIVKVLAD